MFTAWELHKLLPKSELKVIVSGHSATEEGIASELVNATNSFSSLLTGKV